MCNCLKKSTENVIEHISKKLSEKHKNVEVLEEDSHYTNVVLSLSNGWQLMMPFELRYTFEKKDSSRSSVKTEKITIFPTFCPFCGKKIERKESGKSVK